MRIGIFGGTFDPPHIGHLILASEAFYQLELDNILWVITPDPPHKQKQAITPTKHRLDMTAAAISNDPNFMLSRIELDRLGPHYVADTMHMLRNHYPHGELIYLIGGDSLQNLPTWNRPRQFLTYCDALGVMRRPGAEFNLDELEIVIPGLKEKVRIIDTPLIEIASFQIRERIAQHQPFRYFLPEAVYQIIQERKLYR